MSDFDYYQREAQKTAIYDHTLYVIYPTLGLCGEAGEVAEKVKKVFRDKEGIFRSEERAEVAKELGDVLWYLSNIASDLGLSLHAIAQGNLQKLAERKAKGTLQGSGDNR